MGRKYFLQSEAKTNKISNITVRNIETPMLRHTTSLLVAVVAGLACNSLMAAPGDAANDAVNQFTVAEGLQVSLFASEPMLRNPTDMDIDERGRVWLAEGVNYRSTFQKWGVLQPAGDRIVILEDTNGDGRATQETVFYQDPSINAALGICVLGNKVIISDSPNVFVLTDTDGDGKADQRELLFTGIGGVDHDHGVHAFVFGPDGKLYFNMGNEGKQLARPLNKIVPLHGPVGSVPSQPVIDLAGNEVNGQGKPYRMGMVFRCNPDGSEVETLAWNFRNNYEVAVDSFGTLWQSDNDDDGNRGVRINYVMEFGNFGYSDEMTGAGWSVAWDRAKAKGARDDGKVFYEWHQYDPGVVPNLLHTGAGSPTGLAVYEGKQLPDVFRNQMVHCDAGPRVVRAYPVQSDGAGYRVTITNILTTSDTWFRPSDVCVAPDGSLYVADWNDAGVGGHYMADQKVETMTGRVYRVAPKGNPLSVPRLDLGTVPGSVQALQSPNQATRYLAWTKLNAMQGKAEKELLKLWQGKDARMRARALQLLARIQGKEHHYVEAALKDSDPNLLIAGLRIARELKLDVIPYVKQLARDPNPQVRRECAIALRHNSSAQAPTLWAELATQYDGQDRWYLEALGIGADSQWDKFFDAWLARAGDKWNLPAGRELVWRSRSQKTPALLVKIIQDGSLNAEQRDHYFRSLDFIPGPEKDAALVGLLTTKHGSTDANLATIEFEALNRLKGIDLEANPGVQQAVLKELNQARGTPQFVEIVRDFNLKGQDTVLLEIAAQNPASSTGAEAVRLILNQPNDKLLKNSLAGTNAINIAEALGNTGEQGIVPLLTPLVADVSRAIALRKQVVRSLAQVQSGAAALLQLAEEQKLPADLKLTASTALNNIRWQNLKAQAAQLLPLPQSREAQPLPSIAELVLLKGDAAKGAAVFRSEVAGCNKCHQINSEGIDFGPNLSEIGTKLGKDALYQSILDPSAGISFGFEAWQINLKNGDEAYGLIVSETADELALKAPGGVVTRYKKSDIVSRARQKVSAMPAGLQQALSRQDFVDLVEYLSSLKKASP
jgi:putative membrane-bound dehydrogenase-like protein